MVRCSSSASPFDDLHFQALVATNAAARVAMDGITDQDYLENPELRVYVEDALRLVLAARPESPLKMIDEYLQSVLAQDNVLGREYAYVNATMRNRRAFILTVHKVFVGDDNADGASALSGPGFAQKDVLHLVGLVCPDFPEELVARVVRIITEGSGHPDVFSTLPCATSVVSATDAASDAGRAGATNDSASERSSPSRQTWSAASARAAVEKLPFAVFLRAVNVYFYFQEFFQDTCALFGSLSTEGAGGGAAEGGQRTREREVSLRILLDQLQLMKAEPRNQLRYMDMHWAELAVRKGGLGERVTLSALLACLLLHSEQVAAGLLQRVPTDDFADRFEACPALWNDDRASLPPSREDSDQSADNLGRRRKGGRRTSGGRIPS